MLLVLMVLVFVALISDSLVTQPKLIAVGAMAQCFGEEIQFSPSACQIPSPHLPQFQSQFQLQPQSQPQSQHQLQFQFQLLLHNVLNSGSAKNCLSITILLPAEMAHVFVVQVKGSQEMPHLKADAPVLHQPQLSGKMESLSVWM